jgi:hypothetical protein
MTNNKWIFFIFLLSVTVIILIWIIIPLRPEFFKNQDTAYNGINALFTGLAFAGVIYTVLLQKEELKLQRSELNLARKELQRAADAQKESEKALKIQAQSMELQARLIAISNLINALEYYKGSTTLTKDSTLPFKDINATRLQLLELLTAHSYEFLDIKKEALK